MSLNLGHIRRQLINLFDHIEGGTFRLSIHLRPHPGGEAKQCREDEVAFFCPRWPLLRYQKIRSGTTLKLKSLCHSVLNIAPKF